MSCGVGHRLGLNPMLLWLKKKVLEEFPCGAAGKDLMLLQWLKFNPLSRNFHMLWIQPKRPQTNKQKPSNKQKKNIAEKLKANGHEDPFRELE